MLCFLQSSVCGTTPTPYHRAVPCSLVFFCGGFFLCLAVSFSSAYKCLPFLLKPNVRPRLHFESETSRAEPNHQGFPPHRTITHRYYYVNGCGWVYICPMLPVLFRIFGDESAVHTSLCEGSAACVSLWSLVPHRTQQVSRNPAVHTRGPYPCWGWIYINDTTTWRSNVA